MNTRVPFKVLCKRKEEDLQEKDFSRNFFSDIREKDEKGYDDFLKRKIVYGSLRKKRTFEEKTEKIRKIKQNRYY